MPGQNQYFRCFEIDLYMKDGKCILCFILVKCEAFVILFWAMKLLIDVKTMEFPKTLCRDKINILDVLI